MEPQNYKNYIRFYTPHHFIFYPGSLALLVTAVYNSIFSEDQKTIWIFSSFIIVLIIWVSFMLRQHYALTLQNRLIKLEMRYRYFSITSERLELLENQLSDGQIFALRFASDSELPNLVNRTIAENLSPEVIKKSIANWKADHDRV